MDADGLGAAPLPASALPDDPLAFCISVSILLKQELLCSKKRQMSTF